MLGFLGDAFGAIAGGGITGILGTGLSMLAKYKLQKLQNDFELSRISAETEQMRMEQATRMAVADIEADAQKEVSADSLMGESYGHDKAAYATGDEAKNSKWFVFLDFLRGSVRPVVTYYLMILTSVLTYKIFGLLDGIEAAVTAEQAVALIQQSVLVILYLTATVTLWWFGTRSKVLAPK